MPSDFARSFFHAICEQAIFLLKPIEWTDYITDKNSGKITNDDSSGSPYYGICHAKTCEQELSIFGYTYASIYDKIDGVYVTRKAIDKAVFKIELNKDYKLGKSWVLDLKGHKVLHTLYVEYKSIANRTYTRYEKKNQ